jgi:long-chain acyl-CoA synthetase
VADRLVLSKVRARLGGELRFAISGGAPISVDLLEFFHAFGVLILEGYGLTECMTGAINQPRAFRFGTVGKPFPGGAVRLAADGEVLLSGDAVFSGYHNKPEATAEALNADGWVHTGDIGEFDSDGFLRITDRKKDLIATSAGKKISPQLLAGLLTSSKLISQALIVGDRRPYIVALLTLDPEDLGGWARSRGLDPTAPGLAGSAEVHQFVAAAVERANCELARPEQIKRFAVLPREFSAEDGEVTPTLKLRRRVCEQHFAAEIAALYSDAGASG